MNKIGSVAAAVALLGASLAANALVLDFNTHVVGPGNPNAVPILSLNPAPNEGGFIDETLTYRGFTFEFVPSAFSGNAWVWMTEPVPPNPGFQSYGYAYNSGVAGNGFLLHGCTDILCTAGQLGIPEVSTAITTTTPFTFQSLKVARFSGDTFEINLFSATGGTDRTITVAPDLTFFTPVSVLQNPLWLGELYNKITFNGVKGFYGVDDITVTPVPEASTYAMMLLGLGAVGFAARRRKAV